MCLILYCTFWACIRVCLSLCCTLWACTAGAPQPVLHTLSLYVLHIHYAGWYSISLHYNQSRLLYLFQTWILLFIEKLDLSISFSSWTLSLHQQKRISTSFPQLNSSLFTKKRISLLLLYLTSFVDNQTWTSVSFPDLNSSFYEKISTYLSFCPLLYFFLRARNGSLQFFQSWVPHFSRETDFLMISVLNLFTLWSKSIFVSVADKKKNRFSDDFRSAVGTDAGWEGHVLPFFWKMSYVASDYLQPQ